jgi:cobalamin synthase
MQKHLETLEEEATHTTDEARMLLPGVQAILGFQLVAVTNTRFVLFSSGEQLLYLVAFVLLAVAMGLIMAPAAYHRQAERGKVTRRFVELSSNFLTLAMIPLIIAFAIDTYLVARLILEERTMAAIIAAVVALVLAALWYVLPAVCRRLKG